MFINLIRLREASETSKMIPDSAITFQKVVPRFSKLDLHKSSFTEGYVNDEQIWYCSRDIYIFVFWIKSWRNVVLSR